MPPSAVDAAPLVARASRLIVALLLACGVALAVGTFVSTRLWPWNSASSSTSGWRSRAAPVYFLHLHKCGGTKLCDLAKLNGETMLTRSAAANCLLLGDSPKHIVQPELAFFTSCNERADFVASLGVSFFAVEHAVEPMPPCTDRMRYVTVVREPVARLRSLACWHKWTGADMVRMASQPHLYSPHLDNYYVRSLAGQHVMALPLGAINATHLRQAKQALAAFHDVVRLEDRRGLARLFRRLDWHTTVGLEFASNPCPDSDRRLYTVDDKQAAVLAYVNRYDIDLYKSVRVN